MVYFFQILPIIPFCTKSIFVDITSQKRQSVEIRNYVRVAIVYYRVQITDMKK